MIRRFAAGLALVGLALGATGCTTAEFYTVVFCEGGRTHASWVLSNIHGTTANDLPLTVVAETGGLYEVGTEVWGIAYRSILIDTPTTVTVDVNWPDQPGPSHYTATAEPCP